MVDVVRVGHDFFLFSSMLACWFNGSWASVVGVGVFFFFLEDRPYLTIIASFDIAALVITYLRL